ncbi:MAG: histidinol dehydrogenase [Candidatus Bathyarchaeia archaeon]
MNPIMKMWYDSSLPSKLAERENILKEKAQLRRDVKTIIDEVRRHGDMALIRFTREFDNVSLDIKNLKVTAAEIEEAYKKVGKEQVIALESIKERVETIEKLVLEQMNVDMEVDGICVQIRPRPIESVGCYVPGGEAAYPSTLIMSVAPAKLAGVSRVVVCSPPKVNGSINPLTLVAADICNVDEFYRVGGAQAVAAMAYGTETIKPVRKIVGPGNKYVTMAKLLVSEDVAIDMPAGPSELLVLADETADPRLVALDLCSQAEHGPDSIVGLITTSKKLAEKVLSELGKIADSAPRAAIITKVLSNNGFIIVCETVDRMVELANAFAPEHVEIVAQNSEEIADKMLTAGLILVGSFSPVALSDYYSGTNHVLPTGGFGKTFSGLSVLNFVRRVAIVECSRDGLLKAQKIVKVLAEAEGLPNHYKAIEGRFEVEALK